MKVGQSCYLCVTQRQFERNAVQLISKNSFLFVILTICYFENRRVYESESKRIYGLIKEFKETKVFGISTANHAKMLADLQDRFDSNAENHEWPDENN